MRSSLDAFASRTYSVGSGVIDRLGIKLDDIEIAAMQAFAGTDPLRMGDLCDVTGMAPSTATDVIDRLVTKGIAERNRTSQDRRIVVVSLTATGRMIVDEIVRAKLKLCKDALAGFSDSEQSALIAILQRLGTSAKDSA